MGDIQCGRKSFVQDDPGLGQLTQQYQATASPRKVKVEQANRRAQGNGRYLALACGPWAVDTASTPSVQYGSNTGNGSSGFAERVELVSSGAVELNEVGG